MDIDVFLERFYLNIAHSFEMRIFRHSHDKPPTSLS